MPPSPSQTFLANREPSIQIYDPIGVILIQTTTKANIVNIHTQARKDNCVTMVKWMLIILTVFIVRSQFLRH